MRKTVFIISAVIFVVGTAALLLFFLLKKPNTTDTAFSGSDKSYSSSNEAVFDDMLAVSLNAVRGRVADVYNRSSCTEIIFDVDEIYIRRSDTQLDRRRISVAFQSDEITLCNGDECILIVSSAEKNNPTYETEADYLLLSPKYNIIKKSDEGWLADDFMRLSGHGNTDGFYDLKCIENAITSNADKFKSYGKLQLVPPM